MKGKSDSFLGRGWAFPPAFNFDRGTTELVEDEKDIHESIRIIIETIPGERMMFPAFGCGIRKFVFESNDPTQISMLKDAIYDALLYYEPRIKIEKIEIIDYTQGYKENKPISGYETAVSGLIHIHLTYTVIITNTRSNMVFPFYLKEGTNL
ncbi:MAG: GPW/gp25 family protein [Prolixibacteraceae bacterium]|jgi:hypothetical protein